MYSNDHHYKLRKGLVVAPGFSELKEGLVPERSMLRTGENLTIGGSMVIVL
jgi:hypothetical protein